MSFTFNGQSRSYLKATMGTSRPAWPSIIRNILKVDGMAGGLLESTEIDIRVIPVEVKIVNKTFSSIQKLKEDLANWLVTDKACELIFNDESDRIYFAIIEGSADLQEIAEYGKGKINFICLDPYKYGPESTAELASSAVTATVSGTEKSDPIIDVTISSDSTYLAISNGTDINLIGNPIKQDEVSIQPETQALLNNGNTLTGWTVSSASSIEASDLMGTLLTDGNVFHATDYGVSTTSWHGPAMKTSLGSSIQDFRLDAEILEEVTGGNQAGQVEVSLLDASSIIIAKMTLTKHFGGINTIYGRIRAGTLALGHDIIEEGATTYSNRFGGVFRLYRKGNVWTAQVFKHDGTKFLSPITKTWVNDESIATSPVTQIQVRTLQRSGFPTTKQNIGHVSVYTLNNVAAGQIPIIVKAGDVISFDHQNDVITKNGESIIKEKAFIGQYFPLNIGANSIVAEPASSVSNIKVRWRDRWR